eukprot:gb/GEZJ01002654.1/.p1 GENE.gb/GEZJ01002654.1/~~gb/GEZJ01002654.1/.p1  ORF type:complete len:107 (-),score=4.36 gb/GEZJ01002654.1/:179-499(-)
MKPSSLVSALLVRLMHQSHHCTALAFSLGAVLWPLPMLPVWVVFGKKCLPRALTTARYTIDFLLISSSCNLIGLSIVLWNELQWHDGTLCILNSSLSLIQRYFAQI